MDILLHECIIFQIFRSTLDLNRPGQIWLDPIRSGDKKLLDLVVSGQIWPEPIRSGYIWSK